MDHQVLVAFDSASLIATGRMRPDCADIRATADDGVSGIGHWLEAGCNTPATRVWVQAGELLGNGNTTLFLYYGNPSAASLSSASATFVVNRIHAAAGACPDYGNCRDMDEERAVHVRGYPANICETDVDRLDWESACDGTPSYQPGDSRDHFYQRFRFLLRADVAGTWSFATDSDDGSELRRTTADSSAGIDEASTVASWYYGHGFCQCTSHNGGLALEAGEGVWLDYTMAEWEGQEAAVLYIARPDEDFQRASADNFPAMMFARRYATPEPTVVLETEEASETCPAGPAAFSVDGDAAALASGLFTGDGTPGNPLVLENLAFQGSPAEVGPVIGVVLQHLASHVVLRNLVFEDYTWGLCVAAAAHVIVESSLVRGNGLGIAAMAGASLAVRNSDLIENAVAVSVGTAFVEAEGNFWGSLAGPAPPGSAGEGSNRVTAGVHVGALRAESALAPAPGGIAVWLAAFPGLAGFLRQDVLLGAFLSGGSGDITASVDGGAPLAVEGFNLVVAGEGNHTVRLYLAGEPARNLTFAIDAHAPWVNVTVQGPHGLLGGELALGIGGCIALTAEDGTSGIEEDAVRWSLDGTAETADAGRVCADAGGSLLEGAHTSCRAATDRAGNRGARGEIAVRPDVPAFVSACDWRNFTVDLTPPLVAIQRPGPGTISVGAAYARYGDALGLLPAEVGAPAEELARKPVLAGRVPVLVEASDNFGLGRVQVLVDDRVAAERTEPPWAFSIETEAFPAGSAVLAAVAWDAAGNSATATQEVVLLPAPSAATDLMPAMVVPRPREGTAGTAVSGTGDGQGGALAFSGTGRASGDTRFSACEDVSSLLCTGGTT